MALVLAMQPGRSFYVDGVKVDVLSADIPGEARIQVNGKAMDSIYTLGADYSTEILPRVHAQLGLGSGPTTLKVVLEAPKDVRILRDSLYEQGQKG